MILGLALMLKKTTFGLNLSCLNFLICVSVLTCYTILLWWVVGKNNYKNLAKVKPK